MAVYEHFGFEDIDLKIALRPDSRIGSEEVWDKAENALRSALRACDVRWAELPGEGAFYGPKIEYHMKDSIGRAWQVGTMQVDFSMPGRLGAEYVGEDSQRHVPVMLHRAIVGSMERFIGILIEHHAGAFPVWLAPVQAVVMNITDAQADYVNEVAQPLWRKDSGSKPICETRRSAIKSGNTRCRRCPISWSSAIGKRRRGPLPCVFARARTWVRCPSPISRRVWSPMARGPDPHASG